MLWITIPRTEEFHEKHSLGPSSSARTVFVLQIHCKGALMSPSGSGAGSAQTWELKKRYGYFERVHKFATRCAQAAGEPVPAPPQGRGRLRR